MSGVADEEKNYYADLVTRLKSRNYSDALGTIQDDLNLPAETSYAEMEALLIFMIDKTYAGNPNVDITLMALGLLTGFSNREERPETSQERGAYTERREKFLKTTDYIAIKYDGSTYKDAEQNMRSVCKNGKVQTELDTIRSTLDTATSRCLAKVISSLYGKKGSANDYLNAAKAAFEKSARDKNIKRINWSEKRISEKLLPTMKCFKMLAPESPEPPNPPEPPEPEPPPDKSKEGITLGSKILVPFWAILLVVLLLPSQLPCCSFTLTRYSNPSTGEKLTQLAVSNEPQHREYTDLLPPINIGNEIYYECSSSPD